MSSSIGGISSVSSMTYGIGARGNARPPDPATMAKDLLAELDTDGNGSLAASELQTAIDQMSSVNGNSSVASTDEVFAAIDANEDGEVTESELSDTLQTIADSLDFAQGMGGPGGPGGPGGVGGPPPPSSDSESDSSQIIAAADTNEDGTVSLEELIAYNQSSQESSSATTDSATSATSSTPATATESTSTDGTTRSAAVMQTIMQLVQSYGATDQTTQTNQQSGLLSLSA